MNPAPRRPASTLAESSTPGIERAYPETGVGYASIIPAAVAPMSTSLPFSAALGTAPFSTSTYETVAKWPGGPRKATWTQWSRSHTPASAPF